MPSLARNAIGPAYLFACLILGGSAQGIWQNMVLELVGLAIIAWAAASKDASFPTPARSLLLVLIAVLALAVLQSIPVPPSLFAYGLRERVLEGYAILGQPVPWLPISLDPYGSLSTIFGIIPPLAVFCAIMSFAPFRASWLAAALLAGAVAGTVLGALQVVAPGEGSPWYLYHDTNRGVAVGFFANANHMADLLVVALPFGAALAVGARSRNIQRYSALLTLLAGVALLLLVGIVLNGSLAGYVLMVPAIAASVLIVRPASRKLRLPIGLAAAVALAAGVGALVSTSIGSSRLGQEASGSVQSRQDILRTTAKAIGETMPLGSGLGSFVKVYRLYEDPSRVTPEYVVHAHNDYAELTLELGAPGALLIVGFLVWWAAGAAAAWRTGGGGPYARAASVASAVILVHSLVDFPLRTAAISACFATCLALLIDRRPAPRQDATDLRPARHVVVK